MRIRRLLALALIGFIAPLAWATNYDLRPEGSTAVTKIPGLPGRLVMYSKTVDFSEQTVGSGDTYQVLQIPAKTFVLAVGADVTVITSNTLTFDVGDSTDADGYLNNLALTSVANYSTLPMYGHRRTVAIPFFVDNLTSSGAVTTGTCGGTAQYVALPAYSSVVGISTFVSAAPGTGTITAEVLLDGAATGLANSITTATTKDFDAQANNLDVLAADGTVGVAITGSSDMLPTGSIDVNSTVFAEINDEQGDSTTEATKYTNGKYYSANDYLLVTASAADAAPQAKVTFTIAAIQF